MPSRMIKFKNHLQFLSLDEQISKINFAIDKMHNSTNIHIPGDNIDIKLQRNNYIIMHIICFN